MSKKHFIVTFILLLFLNFTFAQKYYLIVLSTASKADALVEADKLKAGGFVGAGYLYSDELNRYRVYLNTYDKKELAEIDASKYKTKFHDSWVFFQPPQSKAVESIPVPTVNNQDLEDLKDEYNQTQRNIQEILDELSQLKISLHSEAGNLHESSMERNMNMLEIEERIKKLTDYIDQLEEEQETRAKQLSENLNEIKSNYVKQSDTVSVSWSVVAPKNQKRQTVLYFSFGFNQTNILSRTDTLLLDYLDVDRRNYSNTFWGIYTGLGYNFAKNWSAGVDFQSYFYNNYYYVQPSFFLKPHIRSSSIPVTFNPSLAVGTLLILPKTGTPFGGRYILIRPGIELEWNISNSLSIFGGVFYHSNSYVENKQFIKSNTQHLILNLGLRFNVTKIVSEPEEPIENFETYEP